MNPQTPSAQDTGFWEEEEAEITSSYQQLSAPNWTKHYTYTYMKKLQEGPNELESFVISKCYFMYFWILFVRQSPAVVIGKNTTIVGWVLGLDIVELIHQSSHQTTTGCFSRHHLPA